MNGRVVVVVVVILLAFALGRGFSGEKDVVPWRADYRTAEDEAHRTGKPLLVYFTASWCGPCIEMKRTTFTEQKVATALSDRVPVKIDIDAHPEIAQAFAIEGVPTMVLLEPGLPQRRTMGYVTADELVEWVR